MILRIGLEMANGRQHELGINREQKQTASARAGEALTLIITGIMRTKYWVLIPRVCSIISSSLSLLKL